MEKTQHQIVIKLRTMATHGYTAAKMLREITPIFGNRLPHKLVLITHMREAFCLSLAEAGPIGGWSGVNAELSDDQLNEFIDPAIKKHEDCWQQISPLE